MDIDWGGFLLEEAAAGGGRLFEGEVKDGLWEDVRPELGGDVAEGDVGAEEEGE